MLGREKKKIKKKKITPQEIGVGAAQSCEDNFKIVFGL